MIEARTRVLLDFRGLMLHAFYSGDPMDAVIDEKGDRRPSATHGVDNFIRLYLQPILERFAPIDVIAVMEGGHSNARRRALFEKYKARAAQDADSDIMKAELEKCFVHLRKLMLSLGMMIVKTPYAEADDTIGYLCERLRGGKMVYTVDNDLLQLAAPNVRFLVKGKLTDEYKGMKLHPYNCVRMYKAICGDSTDGYCGVRGVGEKKWDELVARYGYDGIVELEALVRENNWTELAQIAQDNGDKVLQKLYECRDELTISYLLASIHPEWCEASFNEKVVRPQWEKRVPTIERLRDALTGVKLTSWIEHFRKFTVQKWHLDAPRLAQTKLSELIGAMRKSRFVTFDYESYDKLKHPAYSEAKRGGGYIDVLNQEITGCSFAFGANMQYCFYMSVKHRDTYNCKKSDLADMLHALDGVDLIAHNGMFEMTVTAQNLDIKFDKLYDTYVMANYVDENGRHDLKGLSKKDLNYDQTKYRDVVPEGKDMRDVSGAEVLDYGCDDSICTAHLAVLYQTVMECEQTWDFYEENEVYFDRAMLDCFLKGIPLDYERLRELREHDENEYADIDAKMRQLLVEHCSEVNNDGFITLWSEIEPFERKKLEAKEATPDMILHVLNEKKVRLYAACKYTPQQPPKAKAVKSQIADIGRRLNLPTIRSLKEDWIETYYQGIQKQLEEGATATDEQKQFVDLLHAAVEDGSDEAIGALEAWMQAYIQTDKSMWSGDELNARSPKQMAELFYGKLGLPVLVRNGSVKGKKSQRELFELEGAPSTNENALRTWLVHLDKADVRYTIIEQLLKLRAINTRMSLYYNPYPLWESPIDHRIHPQIKNCGTITKRPSGTSPNVFQVSKTKDDGHVRGVYQSQSWDKEGAEPELVCSIDFEQQELVILAGESGDQNLRACYTGPRESRRDVHTSTGAVIYNLRNPEKPQVDYLGFKHIYDNHLDDDEPDLTRRSNSVRKVYAKRTNFLASYGGGPTGLARKLIVPLEVAKQFLNGFFESYPLVKDYQQRMAAMAKRHGYAKDCFGNRRHLYMIYSDNKAVAASAERQAGNYPIQGGAASVLKIVLREFVKRKIAEKYRCTLYAPIYDELVLSIPVSQIYACLTELADIMEMQLPGLNIGLSTSVSIGKNWGEQIELGNRPELEAINAAVYDIQHPGEERYKAYLESKKKAKAA